MSGVLDILKLEPGSSRHIFRLTADDLRLDSKDVADVLECKVALDIDCHPGEIIARGQADVTLSLECARCLEPFEIKTVHNLAFVIKLLRKTQQAGGEDESSEDYFVIPDSTGEFDVTPNIRERILLSLPLKPLCDQNCKGLCPKCGVNRNVEECDCSDDGIDERWNDLKKLKQQYGGN